MSRRNRITRARLAKLDTESEITMVNRAIAETTEPQELQALHAVIERLQERLKRQIGTIAAWEALDGIYTKESDLHQTSLDDNEKDIRKKK